MGDIFEKLLLSNEVISKEELLHYKKIQAADPKKHLGDILLEKGLIDADVLAQLKQVEDETKQQQKAIKKEKRDKKILEVVQKLGIICQKEIVECIREQRESEAQGNQVFLVDLFLKKGYLTPYLIHKFYKRGTQRIPLPEGVKSHENLVVNIPQYLRDRFLGKIAVKNHILTQEQLQSCWNTLKKCWPRKALDEIMREKNMIKDKKLKSLLDVLKNSLPQTYPYYNAQLRDTQLGKLLIKRNFLSPWRLNKCLLKQLEMLKDRQYISLREILVSEGYLSNYQFDSVLKQYGDLVTIAPPDFLVPPDEIKVLKKEEIEKEIQEAESDVHLIVEEEDIESFDFDSGLMSDKEAQEIDTDIEEDELEGELDQIEEENEKGTPLPLLQEKAAKNSAKNSAKDKEEILYPKEASLVPESRWKEEALDIEVEENLDFDLPPEEMEKAKPNVDINMHEVLDEVAMDASEECYAEELVMDDLKEIEKQKKKKEL
jgi:hypothetical protein